MVGTLRSLALSFVADHIHLVGFERLAPALQQEALDLMEERRPSWSDESFAALLQLSCDETVQAMNLRWCTGLSEKSLSGVVTVCPALRSLDLGFSDTTNEGLRVISEHLPHLEELRLVDCNQLMDSALKGLTRCQRLQVLDCELCSGFTDAAVMHLAKRLPELSKVSFGGCRQVTNVGVQAIAEHRGKQLRGLSIAGNPNVTDYDVEDLCKACANLEELNLRACVRLTDGAVAKIGKLASAQVKRGGPCLRQLDIGGCGRVTDKGMRSLGAATALEILDLRGLQKLSVPCLVDVLDRLRHLRQLNITACTTNPAGAAIAVAALEREPGMPQLCFAVDQLRGCTDSEAERSEGTS